MGIIALTGIATDAEQLREPRTATSIGGHWRRWSMKSEDNVNAALAHWSRLETESIGSAQSACQPLSGCGYISGNERHSC